MAGDPCKTHYLMTTLFNDKTHYCSTQGCRNYFLYGGAKFFFFGALRHISDFLALHAKTWISKKFAFLTEIFKNYLIRF